MGCSVFFSLSRILLMIGDWRSSSNKRYLIEFHVNFFLYQNNFSSKTCDAMLTIRFEINCTRHFGLDNRGAWMNWKHAKSFPISVGGWVRGFSTQNRPSMMTWIIVLMVGSFARASMCDSWPSSLSWQMNFIYLHFSLSLSLVCL